MLCISLQSFLYFTFSFIQRGFADLATTIDRPPEICNTNFSDLEIGAPQDVIKIFEITGAKNYTFSPWQRLSFQIFLELRSILPVIRIKHLEGSNDSITIIPVALPPSVNPSKRGIAEGGNDLSITNIEPVALLNNNLHKSATILHPIFSFSRFGVIFQQPAIRWSRNIQILSFTPQLWMWILIFLSLIHIFLTRTEPGWESALCMMVANIAQQGIIFPRPAKLYERIAYLLGTTISMLFFLTYAANLYATIYKSRIPISSFYDLLKFRYTFVNHESSQAGAALLESLIENHELEQGLVTTNTANEIKILIGQPNALLSYFDFFYKVAVAQGYSDFEICERFTWISVRLQREQSWMIRKNLTLRKRMNTKLTFLKERGIINRLYKLSVAELLLEELSCPEVEPLGSVTVEETFLAFLIVLLGIILSFLLLLFQMLYKAVFRSKSRPPKVGHVKIKILLKGHT